MFDFYAVTSPNITALTLISYTSAEGMEEDVQIIPELNSMWFDVGVTLGQSTEDLNNYGAMALATSNKYFCCQRVFSKWLKSEDSDGQYPVTWAGVYKLLRDMRRDNIAAKLQEALSFHGNFE